MNTYIRYRKGEVEAAIQEAHPYFQEQSEEEPDPEKEALELLQGLSPEAKQNLLELVRNTDAEFPLNSSDR